MVQLSVNGERVSVAPDVPLSTRLIEYLRTHTRHRGPKLACGEGGCGACAVICERYDPASGTTSRATLNACLATLGGVDGCALTTSEGLGNSKSGFHPVQEALAQNFASQCGFCSPGITVALAAAADAATSAATPADTPLSTDSGSCSGPAAPDAGQRASDGQGAMRAAALAQGLDGNLCRCTGLRPIIDTCRGIADLEDLCSNNSSNSSSCARTCPDSHSSSCSHSASGDTSDGSSSDTSPAAGCKDGQASCAAKCKAHSNRLPPLPAFPEWLKQYVTACYHHQHQQQQQWLLAGPSPSYATAGGVGGSYAWQQQQQQQQQQQPLSMQPSRQQVWLSPCNLQQLAGMLRVHGSSAQLVAGNTGAGVYKDLWPHTVPVVITPHSVAEMTAISHQQHGVILGGAVTIQQLLQLLRAPAAVASSGAGGLGQQTSSSSSGSSGGMCAGAPASTAKAWGAMADHVERIAGTHVRSAATLGGHFGLCDIRSLPTDLGLLLAAAGARLQVLTVVHTTHENNSGQHHSSHHQQQWPQHQQQHQQRLQQQQQHTNSAEVPLHLTWMSVEAFLADSAVGQPPHAAAAAAAGGGSGGGGGGGPAYADAAAASAEFVLGPDAIAGARPLLPERQPPQHASDSGGVGSSHGSSAGVRRVVTAVWLPYADDASERFWSYRVSWRHQNAHAFANLAVMVKVEDESRKNGNNSSSGGGDGRTKTVSAVRLFVGCPPAPPAASSSGSHNNTAGAAAAAAAAAAGPQSGGAAAAADDEERWVVLRASGVEGVLTGSPMTVQVLISALRQLEQQLQQEAGLHPSSFHLQTLQGMLFKALVPLIHLPHSQQEAAGTFAAATTTAAADTPLSPQLLRLLQLPAVYDPKQLPRGRQVLSEQPPSSRLQQQQEKGQVVVTAAHTKQSGAGAQQPGQCPEGGSSQQQTRWISCHPHAASAGAATDSQSAAPDAAATASTGAADNTAAQAATVSQAGCPGPAPLNMSVQKDAVRLQASGEAEYTADVAAKMGPNVLWLAGVRSTRPLAALVSVDASAALEMPGVVACFTARDIPGSNSVFQQPLLADGRVEYVAQLIALVAATSQTAAERAAKLVSTQGVTYADIPGQQAIITIDQAIAAGSFYEDYSAKAAALKAAAARGRSLSSLPAVAGAAAAAAPGEVVQSNGQAVSSSSSSDTSAAAAAAAATTAVVGAAAASEDASSSADAAAVTALIAGAPLRLNGEYELPAQQHMYMETQTAVAQPAEDGGVKVWSATQSLDAVQQAVAAVLGCSFNQVVVETKRLGGGFGGKASRSMPVAAAAALAASLLQRPVCFSLTRQEDFASNAGRCAGRVEYAAGFGPDGKVVAIQAKVIFRAGAYLDLASNDGAALVNASDSAYDLSGMSVEVSFARCNLAPHTIMRGPGYLQGCMVMEQIMEHIAAVLGKDSADVKAANFLPEAAVCATNNSSSSSSGGGGSVVASKQAQQGGIVTTALGRVIAGDSYTLARLWRELLQSSRYQQRLAAVQQHNAHNCWSKRGIVVTPVRFDCAPAAVSASLSVYADGSVLVSHGGIEMGQGLSTKVKQAAVAALSTLLPEGQRPLPLDLVRLSPSSSCINPNGGPTWSSTGSEGNCQAVMDAAAKIVERLRPSLKVGSDARSTWQATIAAQFTDVGFAPSAVMLSAYGFFDGTLALANTTATTSTSSSTSSSTSTSSTTSASGSSAGRVAVQYSAFGAAVTEVELDMLTGERRVLATDIAYDCGAALNPRIDLGQVEGAFVMGLGAMLCEEVVVDDTGVLKSDSTWTYKVPGFDLIPQRFTVSFLSDAPNPVGIAGSRASGEPALMTATSAMLALQQAAAAAVQEIEGGFGVLGGGESSCGERKEEQRKEGVWKVLTAPATPQRLKGVVGAFSIADALEAAAVAGQV